MESEVDMAAVRERLQLLAERSGGRLTPHAVVEDARDSDSPLHRMFTWDESEGFQKYLIDRARAVIRSVRIQVRRHETVVSVPVFVRSPDAAPREQGYVALERLRDDPDRARDAVVREFSSATAALRRARSIAAALGLDQEIEDTIHSIDTLRTRALESAEVAGHA